MKEKIWMPEEKSHNYTHHPSFIKELDQFTSDHCDEPCTLERALSHTERLLNTHFLKGNLQFTTKHLGQAQGFGAHSVMFLHMQLPDCGLSRTQMPKAYFYKNGDTLGFLCLDSHIQNYKDSKLRKVAQMRLNELLEIIS